MGDLTELLREYMELKEFKNKILKGNVYYISGVYSHQSEWVYTKDETLKKVYEKNRGIKELNNRLDIENKELKKIIKELEDKIKIKKIKKKENPKEIKIEEIIYFSILQFIKWRKSC